MMTLIESYAQACPDGKIVLMGYSQGAQVVADTLLGSSTGFGGWVWWWIKQWTHCSISQEHHRSNPNGRLLPPP